jgi:hypothetical protein
MDPELSNLLQWSLLSQLSNMRNREQQHTVRYQTLLEPHSSSPGTSLTSLALNLLLSWFSCPEDLQELIKEYVELLDLARPKSSDTVPSS